MRGISINLNNFKNVLNRDVINLLFYKKLLISVYLRPADWADIVDPKPG